MNLFEMNNGVLRIQPEAYALIPFKLLWDRDKSKDKNTALSELAYVYYMADYTSDFADIVDLEDRDKEVRKNCIRLTNWNTDKYRDWETDRKSTRLNSSHSAKSRMPSSA